MKEKIIEVIEAPEGVNCNYQDHKLTCTKGSLAISRQFKSPEIKINVEKNKISVSCDKATKNQYKIIKSLIAHIKNIFLGLDEKFKYELEAVNVHFPMTFKVEGNKVAISNFLGEKTPRYAKILQNVNVEIKGQKITVSSNDREAAGQTAANLEKATSIKGRDRRIFQDGIFIVSKPVRFI